jgi:L-alanine-DL-glutamate epimerase-like enolase superfamily enzyme
MAALMLAYEPITLDLRTTFRIAHGASDQRHNVIVRLNEGIGEGAGVAYLGETQAGIIEYLSRLSEPLGDDPAQLEDILARLPEGSRAARAAVDIALHDLWGKRIGQPLYRLLGLNPARIQPTSLTIAIDEPARMAELARQSGAAHLKIKLGSPDDEAIVAAIRDATSARLRVDANAGWTREQAARIIPRLAQYDLELVEQPLPLGDVEGLRSLRGELRAQGCRLPIFADENVKTSRDVAAHAGAVDGVVIKLMKTGGIREALRAIHTARAHDMRVMISCMIETSVGVTAAAHVAALCDYVDLDGPLLIRGDPFQGVRYEGGRLALPDGVGLGVAQRGE